ncbi:MAG: 16S rRNA (guanine(966)-N(2))-methyltransferase RsmD [Magnetococcales bacterium]|nr:16S rRNA (guanine(966)-N(2))-methyltransferase RsmD [Magnetococcales bacterium]
MVKISGGQLRGRMVQTPMDLRVRPTTGRVRESLFSILGDRINGAWVLDLFAGSGLLGIEALSRGAQGALFVERDLKIADLIRHNLRTCGIDFFGEVVGVSALHPGLDETVQRAASIKFGTFSPFELVFMDPPYRQGMVPSALKLLSRSALLVPGAVVVAEHEAGGEGKEPLLAWHPLQNREYGDTRISFWQWRG